MLDGFGAVVVRGVGVSRGVGAETVGVAGAARLAAVLGGMRSSGAPAGTMRVASGSSVGSSAAAGALPGLAERGWFSFRDIERLAAARIAARCALSLSQGTAALTESHEV
ncbi:hypothetical protein [Roseateles chitinivorans]|uniref:hypothetical protein n=1 Tax=Roseateles chitinivorans TaxID=2917965 RepID=UPI003D6743BE